MKKMQPMFTLSRARFITPLVLVLLFTAHLAAPAAFAQPRPAGVKGLPQEHEYQKQLRAYFATLTAKDFELPRENFTVSPPKDADEKLSMWALSLQLPLIGGKRAAPGMNLSADQFTLAYIENGPEGKVMQPSSWPEPLAWLANWKYPGNPYYDSRALKLRAFVVAAQDMMMVDEQHEHNAAPMWRRADWFSPHLLMYACIYESLKSFLPEAPRKAYEAGLKKMVQRVVKWGPRGEETFLDIQAAVAMTILYQTLDDPELKPICEAYVKRFMAPGAYYNPAGYFADQGCFDPGFNGLTLYFATWLASRAPAEWPWAKQAVAQSWKLRGYLILPEPSDNINAPERRHLLSPTHMTFRTSSSVYFDQWHWPFKHAAAAFLTDDAICQAALPNDEEVNGGAASAISVLNIYLKENGYNTAASAIAKHNVYLTNDELKSEPWAWRMWPDSPVFPMVNYAFDYYPKGFAAHLAELRAKNSPLLKFPFQRPGSFIEQFDKSFLIVKNETFGVVIHTGPVSEYVPSENMEYVNAPYGLSGGTLSAFWSPATGSTVLGRRSGMDAHGGAKVYDKVEEWRNWPVHAVIGTVGGDKFFTSARIQKPETTHDVKADRAIVKVSGVIPAAPVGKEKNLAGKLEYSRTFNVAPEGVRVETSVKGDGVDKIAELYEAIPVFHREGALQAETVVAKIEFQVGGAWVAAATAFAEKVTAIRITRFGGATLITLDRARRVKLSPAETGPGFLTGGVSRNVLIDLLESGDQPAAVKEAKTVSWTIAPVK